MGGEGQLTGWRRLKHEGSAVGGEHRAGGGDVRSHARIAAVNRNETLIKSGSASCFPNSFSGLWTRWRQQMKLEYNVKYFLHQDTVLFRHFSLYSLIRALFFVSDRSGYRSVHSETLPKI